jgi:hypothetical protein
LYRKAIEDFSLKAFITIDDEKEMIPSLSTTTQALPEKTRSTKYNHEGLM